jgi:hypothetical protein
LPRAGDAGITGFDTADGKTRGFVDRGTYIMQVGLAAPDGRGGETLPTLGSSYFVIQAE